MVANQSLTIEIVERTALQEIQMMISRRKQFWKDWSKMLEEQ